VLAKLGANTNNMDEDATCVLNNKYRRVSKHTKIYLRLYMLALLIVGKKLHLQLNLNTHAIYR